MKDSYAQNINNQTINSENSVKLLAIEIINALSLDKNISNLCKKASNQLNAIGRIQKYVGLKEKEVLLNGFILSNFNYCPFLWHICSSKSCTKFKKYKSEGLEYYITILRVNIINFETNKVKLLLK